MNLWVNKQLLHLLSFDKWYYSKVNFIYLCYSCVVVAVMTTVITKEDIIPVTSCVNKYVVVVVVVVVAAAIANAEMKIETGNKVVFVVVDTLKPVSFDIGAEVAVTLVGSEIVEYENAGNTECASFV